MTVEQTTQLLQITCNSLLLALVSGVILAVLLLRQTVLEQLGTIAPTEDSRRILMRKRQLQQNQNCLFLLSYGFGAALISGFCIALRMLVNWQWLIPVSLGVFVLAIALVLGSVGMLVGSLMGVGEGRRKRSVESGVAPGVALEKTLGRQVF